MTPARTNHASWENSDNNSASRTRTGSGSTDNCSESNTTKASDDPGQAGGVKNSNNSGCLPVLITTPSLASSATPTVSTGAANPAQAATSSDATATPFVNAPPPKSGVQNLAGAQQGTLSKPSASVDPAAPIVSSSTVVRTTIITEDNGDTSTSSFTTVIPVTISPSVGHSGSSGGSKGAPIAPIIGGTIGAIVVIGILAGILLFLQKRKRQSEWRTMNTIEPFQLREVYSAHTIEVESQRSHEARLEMVEVELNRATSSSMTNPESSSHVKPVPVPSITGFSTDTFSDDATIRSLGNSTPTSVDTLTSSSMTNPESSSHVKPVPVPSITEFSTDPFSDYATIGSLGNFTPTSVDTLRSSSMTNPESSSHVKPVPVPSTITEFSTDPYSDYATIGSLGNFTPTSVDTFEDLKLAEAGQANQRSSPFLV